MAGRPSTPVGTHGNLKARPVGEKLWEARTYFRDFDGELREVRRRGGSKTAAENALKLALRDRRSQVGAEITGDTRLRDVGVRWLAKVEALVEAGDRAPRTLDTYASAWRLHIEPALGSLRLIEATTERCERWLVLLRKSIGPSMCGTSRTVLSGILGYAARMGAIPTNPVRDLSPIPGAGKRKRKPRAMTLQERRELLEWLDTNVAHDPAKKRRAGLHWPTEQVVKSRALGDITRFMLATGCRIGEAMAVSWDEVDLDASTVAICWHLVRAKGKGMQRMPGAKSDAGDRVLRLPRWCVTMLAARRVDEMAGYPVFPDTLGGWRDPNLIMRWLRWSREEAGFGWVTSHIFRQTVITLLDEAGLPTSEVADQVGHARIAQTQDYMQRGIASERAAETLEAML